MEKIVDNGIQQLQFLELRERERERNHLNVERIRIKTEWLTRKGHK